MGPVCAKPDGEDNGIKSSNMKMKRNLPKAKWGMEDDPGEERWIKFDDQDLPVDEATACAMKWINDQNKVVFGKYTFIEHNVKVVPRIS